VTVKQLLGAILNMENVLVADIHNVSPSYTENIPEMPNIGYYEQAKDILQTYIVPVIIGTGVLGNTICFIVFVASPLKRISTSVYLAALAFSDTGFLVCLGIGWLESLDIRFFHKEGICQMTVYTSFVFSFTSIWFVNAFTLEMYISVFHPQKSPKLCRPNSARKIVGIISVLGGLMYIHGFVIAKVVQYPGTNTEVCLIMPKDEKTAMILSVIDTVLTLVVPFTMILFMITRLFVHISKFYKTELESSATSTADETNSGHSEHQNNRSESISHPTVRQATEAQTKLTRMLVVTVVVFLVLNLPSHAIKVQFLFRSMLAENVRFTETEGFIQVLFQILYYANFSVNFLLYSACGRSFRSAMMRLSLNVRYCRGMFDCHRKIQKLGNMSKQTNEILNNELAGEQQHSRLVDIHLNEIRFSQLPSIGSEFVCQSPPCLLAFESEQLIEECHEH
jgi:hypothetical protein